MNSLKTKTAVLVIFAGILFQTNANAVVSISLLELTQTSASFDISGTLPITAPAQDTSIIWAINPDAFADPGFAIGATFESATSSSFSGSQILDTTDIGNPTFGDYFYIRFSSNLSGGESIAGSFTATWSSTVFNPSAVSSLDFFWGSSDGNSTTTGTLLDSPTTVPEPASAALLLGMVGLGAIAWRRK